MDKLGLISIQKRCLCHLSLIFNIERSFSLKNPIRIDHLLMRLIFGRRWRDKLWITKKDKAEIVGRIAMASAKVLTDVYDLKPIKIATVGKNPSVNPGLLQTDTGYLMIARSSRLRCYNDVDYIENKAGIDDINYLYTLDKEFQVISHSALDETLLREKGYCIRHCMSDSRLFYWNEQVWAIGAALRLKDGKEIVSQIMYRIEGAVVVDAIAFDSPTQDIHEKNWTPVLKEGVLRFIYSYLPPNILRVDGRDIVLEGPLRKIQGHDARGGTPLVEYANGYLCLVHQAPNMWNGKRSYTHSFVYFSKDLELLEVSEPFYLQRRGLEFAAGIAKVDGGIVVSYGVADRACMVLQIPDRVMQRYLML